MYFETDRWLTDETFDPWRHYRRALEEARRIGDPQLLFQCSPHLLVNGAVGHWDEMISLARELVSLPREGARLWLAPALDHCGSIFLGLGERSVAEALWREAQELGSHTQDAYLAIRPISREIGTATLDGNLELALETTTRAMVLLEEAGSRALGVRDDAWRALPARLYLGRAQEALDRLLRVHDSAGEGVDQLRRGVCLAQLGRDGEARSILETFAHRLRGSPPGPATPLVTVRSAIDLAVLLKDRDAASLLLPVLSPLARMLSTRANDVGCVGRHLGDAAALLGDRDAAEAYYEQGLEVCQRARFRPEIALIRLGLAELLLDEALTPKPSQAERDEALGHIDFAIDEFRAMKMQPALERALSHKGLLHA